MKNYKNNNITALPHKVLRVCVCRYVGRRKGMYDNFLRTTTVTRQRTTLIKFKNNEKEFNEKVALL